METSKRFYRQLIEQFLRSSECNETDECSLKRRNENDDDDGCLTRQNLKSGMIETIPVKPVHMLVDDINDDVAGNEICELNSESKRFAIKKSVRFLVDDNDSIVTTERLYRPSPKQFTRDLYISKVEKRTIRNDALEFARWFYKHNTNELNLLDTLVQDTICKRSQSRSVASFFHCEYSEDDDDSISSLSDSDSEDDGDASLISTAHEWASSNGRGLEFMMSESLYYNGSDAVKSVLQSQELLKRMQRQHSNEYTQDELTHLLAQECQHASASACKFAQILAQGDAMYVKKGSISPVSKTTEQNNLLTSLAGWFF